MLLATLPKKYVNLIAIIISRVQLKLYQAVVYRTVPGMHGAFTKLLRLSVLLIKVCITTPMASGTVLLSSGQQ